jgi:hypothetical protein
MIKPRLILCSGVADPLLPEDKDRSVVVLDALGHDPNVTIKIPDIEGVFSRQVPDRMIDLLEIAAYVYTGDSATRRGSDWSGPEEPWGRDLKFVIPVRDFDFWDSDEVKGRLVRLLNFLSDDVWKFRFTKLAQDRPVQGYFELANTDWPVEAVPQVVMFSGGLDSLAGAVDLASLGQPLVLVSHRPVGQISQRQTDLVRELKARYPKTPILHVPVWINKANEFGHEPTQRTRSFLFGALGVCVGTMVGSRGIRFYENGVVSLNLPVADEVVRARASRTTNPQTLRLMAELYSTVAGDVMVVDNPFSYHTKREVIQRIVDLGCGDLIGLTVSCAHIMFKPKGQQHCGRCSQCIDRRTAVLAGGLEAYDPQTDYGTDVFTGHREDLTDQNIAIHYVRQANEIRAMSPEQFAQTFSLELSRAVRGEASSNASATRIYDMHQRYAADVSDVVAKQISANSAGIVDGSLDPLSLLGLIGERKHKQKLWARYAARIGAILGTGIPLACKSEKPKNEPRLQEIADGILKGHDEDLQREFPFIRWSSVTTKPDFSKGTAPFWIELKYVRKQSDIRLITEDIAADITKYGDGGKHVLFVVYDPSHLILDDRQFSMEILRRSTMHVEFVR